MSDMLDSFFVHFGMPLCWIGIILGSIGFLCALLFRKTTLAWPISGIVICIIALTISSAMIKASQEILAPGSTSRNTEQEDVTTPDELTTENQPSDASVPEVKVLPAATPEKTEEKNSTKIELREIVSREDCNFKINKMEWVEKIRPTNQEGAYTYLEGNPEEKYVVFYGSFKNLMGESVLFSDIPCKIKINGKYEYRASFECEESDGRGYHHMYSTKPLKTEKVIIYASIPNELADSWKTITLTFEFNDNFKQNSFSPILERMKNIFELTVNNEDF